MPRKSARKKRKESKGAVETELEKKLVTAGSVLLSKSDIMAVHRELGDFSLENSGELTFEKDVDREAFEKIRRIRNTGKIRAPTNVYPFVLLRACHIRGEVESY